jgi:hypothetical protein
VLFEGSAVDNQADGVIESNGVFSVVTFDKATVDNESGATIEAHDGLVVFEHSTITNDENQSLAEIQATAAARYRSLTAPSSPAAKVT